MIDELTELLKLQVLYLSGDGDPLWFSTGKGSDELIPTGAFANSSSGPPILQFSRLSSLLTGADIGLCCGVGWVDDWSSIHALETYYPAPGPHHPRLRHPRPRRRCRPHGTRWCARDCLANPPNILSNPSLRSRAGAGGRRVCRFPRRRRAVRTRRTGTASRRGAHGRRHGQG